MFRKPLLLSDRRLFLFLFLFRCCSFCFYFMFLHSRASYFICIALYLVALFLLFVCVCAKKVLCACTLRRREPSEVWKVLRRSLLCASARRSGVFRAHVKHYNGLRVRLRLASIVRGHWAPAPAEATAAPLL